ncbi:class I SAM-dependent methyltransferase [Pseudobacteriovorax antillogorgiicola]|uniref:Methyltransferase domain-containing protein n=1 Tax=Pseudobacteriovorax antillogorgiicola TaxID=1513793 RepID=A0A1Y6BX87_9BACT|nr:class I SAM-dependent methyltransferase [Pseudobacteriovorax antillogorgiicola]TCS50312.1 methyltransferase family protein [Pseudobacteriovorax antillogorgiicola]SMF34115.1 Methyltransferase domain-containing protein [Pseudobacteriovorax antillogorgiicola]
MEDTIERIHADVKDMYEAYPYPAYPLWVKLRWQEAYQGTAGFTACLAKSPALEHSRYPRILLAGCGETQPYIIRKIEPSKNNIDAVDISSKSIRRARTRLIWETKPVHFFNADIDTFLLHHCEEYDHVDCYGVLHHLANPTKSLELIHQSLKPGGTVRLMVYNLVARSWIYHVKRALLLLGFDPGLQPHVKAAQEFLKSVSFWVPNLGSKFHDMGTKTFSHPARFVDTFFHAREARIDIRDWFSAVQGCGFRVLGLFDRYAELDDLPNPLWQAPKTSDLQSRMDDKRFENNLEIYLQKETNVSLLKSPKTPKGLAFHLFLKTAPLSWFQFEETKDIPFTLKQKLWWHHIRCVYLQQSESIDLLLAELDTPARQRLARVGAVFPRQVKRQEYLRQMKEPIWAEMETPQRGLRTSIEDTPLPAVIRSILVKNKKRLDNEHLIIKRLDRAQTC